MINMGCCKACMGHITAEVYIEEQYAGGKLHVHDVGISFNKLL